MLKLLFGLATRVFAVFFAATSLSETAQAVAAPARHWTKIFSPSLADSFFVSVIVWAFAAGAFGWQGLLMDGDVGTHIRIGDYILTHHSVP